MSDTGPRRPRSHSLATSLGFLLLGLSAIAAFWAIGSEFTAAWLPHRGSIDIPPPASGLFCAFYLVFGTAAAGWLAAGFSHALAGEGFGRGVRRALETGPDSRWVLAASLLAFLVPAALRLHVLHGMPLADDESCYRFAAQLLEGLRLKMPSPPMKLFFDRSFVINDGSFYTQYPLGWPLLMLPGLLLGVPGYVNAAYSAATIPALFLIVRRLIGAGWARAAVFVWLLAPMPAVAAATELSHTSCTLALAWAFWLALRSRDTDASAWVHGSCAFMISLAFFVRPGAGAGIGGVLSLYWLLGLPRLPRPRRWRAALAFMLPAVAMAVAFLTVDAIQTGSPFQLAYVRAVHYAAENGYRFTHFEPGVTDLVFGSPLAAFARTGLGLWRLNRALFGWPASLLFVPFAGWRAGSRLAWTTATGFVAVHFYAKSAGIDTFGPVHLFELGLPVLILTLAGLQSVCARFQLRPEALLAALTLVGMSAYAPVELRALARIAGDVRVPMLAARAAHLENVVVFTPRPFTRQCRAAPTYHFVFWPPMNDPQLHNPVLWVNHVSVTEDRKLMASFPGRLGFLMLWTPECVPFFLALDAADPHVVPDGLMYSGPKGLPSATPVWVTSTPLPNPKQGPGHGAAP